MLALGKGATMSDNRTGLKIISVVIIAIGLYDLIPGLILIFANASPEIAGPVLSLQGISYTEAMPALVLGITCAITGLVFVTVGLLGWRGAKDPSKVGPFFVFAVIGSILAVLFLIIDLVTGTWPVSSAINAIIVIATAVIAYRVRKDA